MPKRIVLIGAGSGMFGLGSVGNIFKSKVLEGSEIVLHDISKDALQSVEEVARRYMNDNSLNFKLIATTSRKEALQNADFCIIAIEVGNRYELWEQDWHIPQQYGIRGVYGENGGPGGLFHSLRIIPPILDICEDIAGICPEAWVFNLSNPMTRITKAIHTKYPELKVFGLCHEVVSLMEHLPKILGTPWENLEVKAGGLNHFSVLLEARYKDSGKDAYPDIIANAAKYFEAMPESSYENLGATKELLNLEQNKKGENSEQRRADRVKVWPERELFKVLLNKFGVFPITTDSHLGEYVGWAHSVVDHEGILDFYHFYKKWCLEQVPESRIKGTKEIEYWRDIPIIEGLVSNSGHSEMAVNMLNNGYIQNLPDTAVVEVPATIDAGGIHGVCVGKVPTGFAGLLNNQVFLTELTVDAILHKSKELALQALLLDPVVDNVAAAERTLNTIISLQSAYLSYLK